LNYFSNRFGRYNSENGLSLWTSASQLGSDEAETRLIASRILDAFGGYNKSEDFKKLKEAADKGSLFAMVSVGLCYEQGLGITQSIPDAVNYFKLAAQRGSRFAYDKLKTIYDDMRPADEQFLISN